MMRLAKLAKPTGVRFQHLYDPNFWFVVETETEVFPFFAGLQYLIDCYTIDFAYDNSNWGLQCTTTAGKLVDFPMKHVQCNFADAVIFAINLQGGAFQRYKENRGVYEPVIYKCRQYEQLL